MGHTAFNVDYPSPRWSLPAQLPLYNHVTNIWRQKSHSFLQSQIIRVQITSTFIFLKSNVTIQQQYRCTSSGRSLCYSAFLDVLPTRYQSEWLSELVSVLLHIFYVTNKLWFLAMKSNLRYDTNSTLIGFVLWNSSGLFPKVVNFYRNDFHRLDSTYFSLTPIMQIFYI